VPTTPLDVIFGLIFAAWFLTSVLNQLGFRWLESVQAHDHFALLPDWRFFAPDAGQSDYHLLYRDRHPDSSFTPWREIPVTESRTAYAVLWNPEKRRSKILSDIAEALIGSDLRHERAIQLSLPYLLLLNVACHHAPPSARVERQFMIVRTYGVRPAAGPEILFRSHLHTVG
jgi:hypothetical protein